MTNQHLLTQRLVVIFLSSSRKPPDNSSSHTDTGWQKERRQVVTPLTPRCIECNEHTDINTGSSLFSSFFGMMKCVHTLIQAANYTGNASFKDKILLGITSYPSKAVHWSTERSREYKMEDHVIKMNVFSSDNSNDFTQQSKDGTQGEPLKFVM